MEIKEDERVTKLIQKMNKSAEKPIETKPEWRDYLAFLKPTTKKVGWGMVGLGALLSVSGGKIFFDTFNTLTEENQTSRKEHYDAIVYTNGPIEHPTTGKQYEHTLNYSATAAAGGLTLFVGGAFLLAYKPHERQALNKRR